MVKLANTYGSGPYVARLAGSSPVTRTIAQSIMYQGFGRFLLAKKNNHNKKAGAQLNVMHLPLFNIDYVNLSISVNDFSNTFTYGFCISGIKQY